MKKFNNILGWYICFVSLALGLLVLVSCVVGLVSASKKPKITQYPTCGIIVENDERSETVTVEDFNGNHWQFNGVEDWEVGDIVSMIMSDNGTPDSIYDDQIVKVKYSGYPRG